MSALTQRAAVVAVLLRFRVNEPPGAGVDVYFFIQRTTGHVAMLVVSVDVAGIFWFNVHGLLRR